MQTPRIFLPIAIFAVSLTLLALLQDFYAPYYSHVLQAHPFLSYVSWHSPWFLTAIACCVTYLFIPFKILPTIAVAGFVYAALDTGVLQGSGANDLSFLFGQSLRVLALVVLPTFALASVVIRVKKHPATQT